MKRTLKKTYTPFCAEVASRLCRMGVLSETGEPVIEVLEPLACIHAAIFFDALCDCMDSEESVASLIETYEGYLEAGAYRKLFVRQYDTMKKTLPSTAWWIAGNNELIRIFMKSFIPELIAFLQHEEFDSGRQEGGDAS